MPLKSLKDRSVTKKDRVKGALIGGVGCFWIAGLGRIFFGELPVSISVVGVWAIIGVLIGTILGIFFPKIVSCVFSPFSFFGIGN